MRNVSDTQETEYPLIDKIFQDHPIGLSSATQLGVVPRSRERAKASVSLG